MGAEIAVRKTSKQCQLKFHLSYIAQHCLHAYMCTHVQKRLCAHNRIKSSLSVLLVC